MTDPPQQFHGLVLFQQLLQTTHYIYHAIVTVHENILMIAVIFKNERLDHMIRVC